MDEEKTLEVDVEDVTFEILDEAAGASCVGCSSSAGTVSTPATIGTAATIGSA